MPVILQCDNFPLTPSQVEELWQTACRERQYPDEPVAIRCVSEAQSQELNAQYRGKNMPTNVLTFSYPPAPTTPEPAHEHDVALCLKLATREAASRHQSAASYVARLLVHAFLHVTGLDHEKGAAAATLTHQLEQRILVQAGFGSQTLEHENIS